MTTTPDTASQLRDLAAVVPGLATPCLYQSNHRAYEGACPYVNCTGGPDAVILTPLTEAAWVCMEWLHEHVTGDVFIRNPYEQWQVREFIYDWGNDLIAEAPSLPAAVVAAAWRVARDRGMVKEKTK